MGTRCRSFSTVVMVVALLVGTAVAPAGATDRQDPPARTGPVEVFPAPGTPTISPGSQLSFRGRGSAPIRLSAVGSRSGPHAGRWLAHSDGEGTSFVPSTPFTPGEQVTVNTDADVTGVVGGRFSYGVAVPASAPLDPSGTVNTAGTDGAVAATSPQARISGGAGTPTPAGPRFYRTRPDLLPPIVNTTASPGRAPGLLFATASVPAFTQTGPLIYDDAGQPVWFRTQAPASTPTNLTPITYRGQPALAYFQGFAIPPFVGGYVGEWVVLDTAYRDIGRIRTGNGYASDSHELQISPAGDKALMIIYNKLRLDLTAYGGKPDATYLEGVVQEVDLATGAVTFEWHSLTPGNIPVTDNYDPFVITSQYVDGPHLNSAGYDTDGNLLVSGRHISQVLKIDHFTGAVIWRLGGKRNQFTFTDGDGGPSFQHDARRRADGTLSVYDNGLGRQPPYARGVAFRLDEAAKTARVDTEWRHVPELVSPIVGDNRQLPNGNQFVSFGNSGNATEYDANGAVFESQLASGVLSYRTYRAPWRATPTEAPAVALDRSAGGVSIYASWNGATDVARWELLGGPDAGALRVIGSSPRTGFETRVTTFLRPTDRVFQARALDAGGSRIGVSSPVNDPIESKYVSLGGEGSVLGVRKGGEYAIGFGLGQDYQRGAIYWSGLGAFEAHGAIGFWYRVLGGPASVLGFPLSDELTAPDGVGRFNLFAGGSLYWSPASGAHEIHGAIRDKWGSLGYERGFLGYPLTDETTTPDGIGRFNHLQGGSVYWTPSTGAFEVHGAIRDRWASLGYERGRLGYPISDEVTPSNGVRQSFFQGGYIRWYAAFNSTQVVYF